MIAAVSRFFISGVLKVDILRLKELGVLLGTTKVHATH